MKNKKGFTIVELVIVISVIAILAAVLIPTFSNLIRKANVSSDTILVKNLNTALTMDSVQNGKHETMYDALKATEAYGYDIAKINASATNSEILWDSVNDCFVYLDEDKMVYIPDGVDKTEIVDDKDFWIIDDMIHAEYSTYLYGYEGESIEVSSNIDLGENNTVTEVVYKNETTEKQDVIIRTNSSKTNIILDAYTSENGEDGDNVYLYGKYGKVTSNNEEGLVVANHSLYLNGKGVYVAISKGHVVVEDGAEIEFLLALSSDVYVTLNGDGKVNHAHAINEEVVDEINSNELNDVEFETDCGRDIETLIKELVKEAINEEEGIEEECQHEYEYLTNIVWFDYQINDEIKVFKPTCNEEGIAESAYCSKCNETVSNITIPAAGHDNNIIIENYTINGITYDEVMIESSYCNKCDLPVAFVEKNNYNLTGVNPWDVTYTFRPFSCSKIEAIKDGEKVTLEFSVFDLMYRNNGELLNDSYTKFSNGSLNEIDPLVLNVFGVKSETELGAAKYFDRGVTFSIGFNTDVESSQFAIGGYYENFGDVLDDLSDDVSAYDDYEIEILSDFVNYGVGDNFTILGDIVEFKCGFTNKSININDNEPIYATVKLLIENENNGYDVISVFKHQVTKPYSYEAKIAYDNVNDSEKIYKVVDESGKVYYGYDGKIYDVDYIKEFNIATFNPDGTVVFGGSTYKSSTTNISNENSNIKIYEMEIMN